MAITYVTPDGTVLSTLADVSNFVFRRAGLANGTITTATVVIQADQVPGTPRS